MQQVRSFYKFTPLARNTRRRRSLQHACARFNLRGTVILAAEGINGSLCGTATDLDGLFEWLAADTEVGSLSCRKTAVQPNNPPPFKHLRVYIKAQILQFTVPVDAPSAQHVAPSDWNALIAKPEVTLVDVRNKYESCIGTFADAMTADTEAFCDFTDYAKQHLHPQRHRQIALYCTGGIRCEKAGAWLKGQGFAQLYQLTGGILHYLASVSAQANQWQGDCFVFDQRVAVDSDLQPAEYSLCRQCQMPFKPDAAAAHQCPAQQAGGSTSIRPPKLQTL